MDIEIDAGHLIDLVSKSPVIWDKTFAKYLPRDLTQNAWKSVCSELNKDFPKMSRNKQHDYCKKVIKKWRNIRDHYRKSCKKLAKYKESDISVKPTRYMYHDQLSFLAKNTDLSDLQGGYEAEPRRFLGRRCKRGLITQLQTQNGVGQAYKKSKKRKLGDDSLQSDNHCLETHQEYNPKMCFFKSVLPSLKDFTDDEMLQFQSQIINLVQSVKKDRLAVSSKVPYDQESDVFTSEDVKFCLVSQTDSEASHLSSVND